MAEDESYKISVQGDYIHLETWGELHEDDLDKPVDAALKLAEEQKIDKLLDDISGIDSTHVSVTIQAKGVGVLWKLRKFRKVAIVFKGKEIGWLFLSTIQTMHLDHNAKFKGFDNETEAIQWLKED